LVGGDHWLKKPMRFQAKGYIRYSDSCDNELNKRRRENGKIGAEMDALEDRHAGARPGNKVRSMNRK